MLQTNAYIYKWPENYIKALLQMNWNCEFAKQGIESKKLLGMHKCVVKKKWCVQVCNTNFQK